MQKLHKYLKSIHKQKLPLRYVASVVAVAMFGFINLPVWSIAKEINMETPIVRQYKINTQAVLAQSESSGENSVLAPVVPASDATTAPSSDSSGGSAPSAPTDQPVSQPLGTVPQDQNQTIEPVQPLQPVQSPSTETVPAPSQVQPQRQQEKQYQENQLPNMPAIQENFKESEQMEIEIVDPREVKNTLRDIKNLKSQLKSFVKQLGKLPNSTDDIATCNDILSKLDAHYAAINRPAEDESLRDALSEYYDGRYWDEVNVIRAKVEIPKELKNIAKDLKKVKKLVTQKTYQKLGLNLGAMSAKLNDIEAVYNEVQARYSAGELEEAMDAMQEIRDCNSGDIMNILYGVKEIKDQLKRIKNTEVKQIVEELLGEVVATSEDGNYREASMAINEIRNGVMRLAAKFMKTSGGMNDEMRAKFDKFEAIIKEKMGESGDVQLWRADAVLRNYNKI